MQNLLPVQSALLGKALDRMERPRATLHKITATFVPDTSLHNDVTRVECLSPWSCIVHPRRRIRLSKASYARLLGVLFVRLSGSGGSSRGAIRPPAALRPRAMPRRPLEAAGSSSSRAVALRSLRPSGIRSSHRLSALFISLFLSVSSIQSALCSRLLLSQFGGSLLSPDESLLFALGFRRTEGLSSHQRLPCRDASTAFAAMHRYSL